VVGEGVDHLTHVHVYHLTPPHTRPHTSTPPHATSHTSTPPHTRPHHLTPPHTTSHTSTPPHTTSHHLTQPPPTTPHTTDTGIQCQRTLEGSRQKRTEGCGRNSAAEGRLWMECGSDGVRMKGRREGRMEDVGGKSENEPCISCPLQAATPCGLCTLLAS
jgi:hypothetical protein